MSDKTKNTILLSISVLILLVIIGGAVYTGIDNAKKKKALKEESKSIMEKFDDYYNRNENTVIYYASSQCGYCAMQKPILETIASTYKVDYLEIDSIKLSSSERNEILKKLGIEHATPTTVVVNSGEVVDVAIGYKDGKTYVEFLKEAGILPENATYSKTTYTDAPNITVVDYDEYKELIEKDEYAIVTIGQTGCSHCNAIRPALDSIVTKNGLTIYYLNLTDMTREETQDFFVGLEEYGYDDPQFVENGSFGTPTTFTFKNGKIEAYIGGERTYSQLEKEFKKQGLIK